MNLNSTTDCIENPCYLCQQFHMDEMHIYKSTFEKHDMVFIAYCLRCDVTHNFILKTYNLFAVMVKPLEMTTC